MIFGCLKSFMISTYINEYPVIKEYLFDIILCVFIFKLQFFDGYWFHCKDSMWSYSFSDLSNYSKRTLTDSFKYFKLFFKLSRWLSRLLRLLRCHYLLPGIERYTSLLLWSIIEEVRHYIWWILKLTSSRGEESLMNITLTSFSSSCRWNTLHQLLTSEALTACRRRWRLLFHRSKPASTTSIRDHLSPICLRVSAFIY